MTERQDCVTHTQLFPGYSSMDLSRDVYPGWHAQTPILSPQKSILYIYCNKESKWLWPQAPVAAVTWPWGLLTIQKETGVLASLPLQKFPTVSSQSKKHYGETHVTSIRVPIGKLNLVASQASSLWNLLGCDQFHSPTGPVNYKIHLRKLFIRLVHLWPTK